MLDSILLALADSLETLALRTRSHLPEIFSGIAIFVPFWFLSRHSGKVLRRLFERSQTDPALAPILLPLARMSLLVLGLLVAIEQMGFNVGSLIAGLGIAGLAFGLAAQETLANFLAGIALLWDRPFRLGDNVTVAGRFGVVTEIGLRSTRLRTLEQMEVTIPNKEVAQQQIVNHSRYPQIRINAPFSIGYREDLERARALLVEAVAREAAVAAEPPPQVVIVRLGESGVDCELRAWVATPVAESASLFDLLELVKATLDRNGIEMPYPQRTVHLATPVRIESERTTG